MNNLTSKRSVALIGTLGVAVLLIASSRTWVTGSARDAVLSGTHVALTGSKAATGLVAAALVAGAALLAAMTSGRVARRIAAVLAVAAGLLAIASTIAVIADPGAPAAAQAASATGRAGRVAVSASAGGWAWVGLIAAIATTIAGLLALAGARSWDGLGQRYDAPVAAKGRNERPVQSAWDRLSQGEDPTTDTMRTEHSSGEGAARDGQ